MIAIISLLASAFSKILGTPVLTYDKYKEQSRARGAAGPKHTQALDMDGIFRLSYDRRTSHRSGSNSAQKPATDEEIAVLVEILDGGFYLISIGAHDSVQRLKEKITKESEIPCEQQKLTFEGKALDDDHTSISDHGVVYGSILYLIRLSRGKAPITFIDEGFREPDLDFDFTNVDDGEKKFFRGGKRYYRPCGWQRFGIKVMGRYLGEKDGEDDKWVGGLGPPGYRLDSTEGEWPVSYHGTCRNFANSIVSSGYLLSESVREAHGPGIYSAPDIGVAATFAKEFEFKGEKHKLVFQNRVSPSGLREVAGHRGEYWVQENEKLIRPYGICVRRV